MDKNTLEMILRVVDEISKPIKAVGDNFEKFAKGVNDQHKEIQKQTENTTKFFNGMQEVGKGLTTYVTLPILGIGAASIKTAADFEQGMSNIKALTGLTGEEMDKMKKLALEAGAKTKYSALEAASGMEELLKAGVSVKDIMGGGLYAALNLATAGEISVKDAAEIASTALNAFKNDHISAAEAANILAGAANASATSVSDLKYALSMSSSVASAVGMSFKDTNTVLAAFAQNGLKGSDAGTSLKTMLLNLQPKTKEQIELFKKLDLLVTKQTTGTIRSTAAVGKNTAKIADLNSQLAIATQRQAEFTDKTAQSTRMANTARIEKYRNEIAALSGQLSTTGTVTEIVGSKFYDSNGNLKSAADIAQILQDSLKGMTNAQRQAALETMFGTDAIRAANVFYKEGAKGIKDMKTELSKVTAEQVAAEKMKNLWGSIEQLKGSVETVAIVFGSDFLPLFKRLADGATTAANSFMNLNPTVRRIIEVVAILIAAIGPLLVIFASTMWAVGQLQAIFVILSAAIPAVTGSFSALFAILMANPLVLLTVGVAALTAALVVLIANSDLLKTRQDLINQSTKNLELARRNLTLSTNSLKDAEANLEGAHLSVERAQVTLEQATNTYNNTLKTHTANSLEARDAQLAVKEAKQNLNDALDRQEKATFKATAASTEYIKSNKEVEKATNEQKEALKGGETAWGNLSNAIGGAWNNLKNFISTKLSSDAKKAGASGGGMSFATGGWVPETGMALVHKGEYVLSKGMLNGRQATTGLDLESLIPNNRNIPYQSQTSQRSYDQRTYSNPSTTNIYLGGISITNKQDADDLVAKLSSIARNDTSI